MVATAATRLDRKALLATESSSALAPTMRNPSHFGSLRCNTKLATIQQVNANTSTHTPISVTLLQKPASIVEISCLSSHMSVGADSLTWHCMTLNELGT
jgi:hypothetical protein